MCLEVYCISLSLKQELHRPCQHRTLELEDQRLKQTVCRDPFATGIFRVYLYLCLSDFGLLDSMNLDKCFDSIPGTLSI